MPIDSSDSGRHNLAIRKTGTRVGQALARFGDDPPFSVNDRAKTDGYSRVEHDDDNAERVGPTTE